MLHLCPSVFLPAFLLNSLVVKVGKGLQDVSTYKAVAKNSGLLLLKTCVSNTCGPTFYNHFVLCGNFCDCRCNGAMTTPLFSSKKYGMAQCHQPDPVRLPHWPQPAPGSATPTSTVHAFFRCTRWLSTFHRGARPVFTRPS